MAVACAPTPAEPYWSRMVLDLRMPTVAARLLWVCHRVVCAMGEPTARARRDLRFEDLLIHDWTEGRGRASPAKCSPSYGGRHRRVS